MHHHDDDGALQLGQDPESYEVVRDIHQSCSRREMVVPDISKPHFFLARTPSAPVETFTSHVLNLPNEIPEELSEQYVAVCVSMCVVCVCGHVHVYVYMVRCV